MSVYYNEVNNFNPKLKYVIKLELASISLRMTQHVESHSKAASFHDRDCKKRDLSVLDYSPVSIFTITKRPVQISQYVIIQRLAKLCSYDAGWQQNYT